VENRPKPISIWQPATVEGGLAWVRPEPSPLGDHHATRRVLRPRPPQGSPERSRHRICVFGESVAAGYLYAPHLTVALALERWLTRIAGPGHEVIDLARTNETLAGLVSTVEASLQLEPDLLVLFAGNNWNLLETPEVSPHVPSPGGRRRFAEALEQAGLAGPVGLARKTLDGRAREALGRVAELAAGAGADVVAVIPEVNLADWQDLQPPPWLPGPGVAGWYEALSEARAALGRGGLEVAEAAGNLEAAEAAAWRMNRLDGSTTPVPFRLLGEVWRARGDMEDARNAFLAEVDSVHYPLLAFLAAPRATTAARTILAEAAAEHGWGRVDLREVFERHTGSPLPGRRLFLDYCHLTSEGMTVAMAATAAEVLGRFAAAGDEARWDWTELLLDLDREPDPASPEARAELLGLTSEAEATARLGAALHGAHRHLPVSDRRPILEHWCAAALDASPGVAAAMADLAEIRRAPPGTPEVLTGACRRNLASPYPIRLQHGLRWGGLDGEVLLAARAALERALERAEPGEERATGIGRALAAIDRTLTGEPIPPEGLELARGPNGPSGGWRHLAEPLARFYPEAMEHRDLTGRAALRCPWPETGFWLPVGENTGGLRLHLTARLPPIPGVDVARRGTVAVSVDGREAGRCLLGGRWTRAAFHVPAGELEPGLHRVTVRWPMPPPVGVAALDEAKRRLARGVEADLHPVFGEIYSLLVLSTSPGS
jgi:hypothetical protein